MSDAPPTRPSLLVRLRDARDQQAWRQFVERNRSPGTPNPQVCVRDVKGGSRLGFPASPGRYRITATKDGETVHDTLITLREGEKPTVFVGPTR